MSVGRVAGRLAARAVVAGLIAGYVGMAMAADEPARPAPPVAAAAPCPTCTAAADGAPSACKGGPNCKECPNRRFGYKPPRPVAGQLRPDACFGYFQTQWHKWENVCPLPYQGTGLTDSPARTPTAGGGGVAPGGLPAVAPDTKTKGSDAPAPTKTGAVPPGTPGVAPGTPGIAPGTPGVAPGLPVIPPMPPGKFGP